MKKNFLYLFTVLCTLSFFTACSDDDEKVDDSWKAVSATYKAETLILNDVAGKPESTETVKVDATSAEAASVMLGNIVVGEPEVKIDAKLTKAADDSYTLTGENSNSDRVVLIEGSVNAGKLTIRTSVKITSPVVGSWNLKIAEDTNNNNALTADVIFNMETPDGSGALIAGMAKSLVGQIIAKKVEYVTVVYGEDGRLGIAFKSIGTDANSDKIQAIISMLDLHYYVKTTDGKSQLYLAVNKSLLEMGGAVMGEEMMAAVKALLVDAGNYYGLPLNMKIENDYAQFYVSKDVIGKLLPILVPLIPEDYKGMIEGMLPMIESATVLDFGLGFTK